MYSMRRLLASLAIALLAVSPALPAAAARVDVNVDDFAYQPSTVMIAVGDTVAWTNNDVASHTVTFDTLPVDSDILGQGQVFSHTFTVPGSFVYRCEVHPDMQARVMVADRVLPPRLWLPFVAK